MFEKAVEAMRISTPSSWELAQGVDKMIALLRGLEE